MLRACLAGGIVVAACGAPPTTPSNGFNTTDAVQALLAEIVDTMQQQSFKRDVVDWPALRSAVLVRSAGASRIVDAFPAIQLAFQMLNDSHSRYVSASGISINHWTLNCSTSGIDVAVVPPGIGYIRVLTTGGTTAAAYAGAVQSAIRAADSDDTVGWIVDLRGNSGGSTYAMLAGVGPILGDGVAGAFINLDGVKTEWGYRSGAPNASGATLNGNLVVIPSTVYQVRRQHPRVAVLSDQSNMSAGESTLIAFIGRPDTRVFGLPSCGVSTGVAGLPMRDGATLFLARSLMADRTGKTYGGVVLPDEHIANQAQQVARAVQWLQSGQ